MLDTVANETAEFKRSLSKSRPPAGLVPALAALWWAGKDDWARAHDIVMDDAGQGAAWVHAYLHRVERDLPNAKYWYRQAGKPAASGRLPPNGPQCPPNSQTAGQTLTISPTHERLFDLRARGAGAKIPRLGAGLHAVWSGRSFALRCVRRALAAAQAFITTRSISRLRRMRRCAPEPAPREDDLLIALSFSGGGTRAAAFSTASSPRWIACACARRWVASLLDRVDFVSGVSGGSITAAYYGLKKRAALADFRERFLLRDVEAALRTNITPANLSRALAGGINDATGLTRWLDENLFDGATFAEFQSRRSSPAYLDQRRRHLQPHALRVRPGRVFRHVQRSQHLSTGGRGGGLGGGAGGVRAGGDEDLFRRLQPAAAGVDRARPRAIPAPRRCSRAFATAMALSRRRDAIHQAARRRAGRQLRPFRFHHRAAVRQHAVWSADATPGGEVAPRDHAWWSTPGADRPATGPRRSRGPSGPDLVVAAADTAIDASVRASYTAFDAVRCPNGRARSCAGAADCRRRNARRYGAPANWNCHDLKFFVTRVGFDQLEAERAGGAQRGQDELPPAAGDGRCGHRRRSRRSRRSGYAAFLKSL